MEQAGIRTAMLLCAGFGTRLGPLSRFLPKPMFPLGGMTLLERNLSWLAASGFARVVINAHHQASLLEDFAREVAPDGLELLFSREDRILGTGGGIGRARSLYFQDEPVLIVNGDNAFSLEWPRFRDFHVSGAFGASLLLLPAAGREALASTVVDGAGRVRGIGREGTAAPGSGGALSSTVFSGIYILEPSAAALLPCGEFCGVVERVFVPLLRAGRLGGLLLDFPWHDIGTWERYAEAQRALSATPGTSADT